MPTILTEEEQILATELRGRARRSILNDPGRGCITHLDLGRAVDPAGNWRYPMTKSPFRGLKVALEHVSTFETERGRPMVTALVVDEGTRVPDDSFGELGARLGFDGEAPNFWEDELREVVRFWTSDDILLRALDAATDRILSEFGALKDLLTPDQLGTSPLADHAGLAGPSATSE